MKTDIYGQNIYTVDDLVDLLMTDPEINLGVVLTEVEVPLAPQLGIENPPTPHKYEPPGITLEEFDRLNQSRWLMPAKYQSIDLVDWLTSKCTCQEELQRVAAELLLYMERDMFPLLRYLIYLVDTMRHDGIVWGVGRGSSVCSFVLYLIGVHRINPIYWDLDIREFLK